MSDLEATRDALIRAGRLAYRPTAADRGRVLQALESRLGPGVLVGEPLTPSPAAPHGIAALRLGVSGWTVIGLATLGAGVLIGLRGDPARSQGALLLSLPTEPSAAAPVGPPEVDVGAVPSALPPDPDGLRANTAPELGSTHPGVAASGSARRANESLSREVAILSRAEGDLNGGHPDRALKELDEHARRFSDGLLREERMAARIQVLCALGRKAEAMAELARLERTSPHSPHTARARQACQDAR